MTTTTTTTTLAQPPRPPALTRRLARWGGLALAALAVAVGSFLLVLYLQPTAPPPGPTAGERPMLPALGPLPRMARGFGAGKSPWFDNYDDGKLTSRFRAENYTPHEDGSISVTRPVADFLMGGGEVLRLTGRTGEVFLGQPGGNGLPTALHAPTTGTLHHVHIARFPDGDADRGHPTLTMDTDNVHFDNDTLRIYTERTTDADGRDVRGDMVPVSVRGDDYEMDGTGLTLRWNGRDRRLHLLEIAHGHRLTILHPNALHPADGTPPPSAALPASASPPPVALASADPVAVALVPTPPPASRPVTPPAPPYRAAFNDAVVVRQAGQTLATGDVLTLDFMQGKSTDPKPTTAPAESPPPPPTQPMATHQAATQPAAKQAATRPAVAAATTRPDPRSSPVTIYWTGKLRVTPLESPPMMPLAAGRAVVRLAGRPAELAYDGGTASAALATFRTVDQALRLDPSAACPVVSVRQKGTTLDSAGIAFDPATSVATLAGPATLVDRDKAGRPTTVTWADRGLLHVATDPHDDRKLTGVDHVDLAGAVRAVDPASFDLASHRLLLDFDLMPVPPPTTLTAVAATAATPTATTRGEPDASREQLRRMTAVGDVTCRTLRTGEPDRGISGDRLVVNLSADPAGHAVPRTVVADGRVNVSDTEQAVRANHLEAVLADKPTPATRPVAPGTTRPATTEPATTEPSFGLASLLATGDVRAVLKNGSRAQADQLREVTAPDGRQLVELSGPTAATVTDDKGDRLAGSVLHVAVGPAGDVVTVDGPGTLHPAGKPATRPTDPPPAATDVSWVDGLSFDTATNVADVVGGVIARSVDAKGTVMTAHGDTAHVVLADPPKPATRPAPKQLHARPATKPVAGTDGSTLGSRQLVSLTLAGHMHATSLLTVGGVVVRQGDLTGGQLIYNGDGSARVPGPGTLYVLNHKDPTAGPADRKPKPPGAGSEADKPAGRQGEMAMTWRTGLRYDPLRDRVTITGDTLAGFLPEAPGRPQPAGVPAQPMRLRAERLDIDLTKNGPGAKAGQPQVSHLLATGRVHFHARGIDLDCHTADYDPATGLLVAKGSAAEPGRAVDAGGRAVGGAGGEFDELTFDTVRQEVVSGRGVSGAFRR